ncbi:MAG: ATP-binding cassette domain-containing protein [Patescibacteria group bacterium]|jgi:polar amino acid transport system ATP-binding protein/sulfate transport system ATP-binding protein
MITDFSYTTGETLLRIEGISMAYGKIKKNPDGSIASAEHLILDGISETVSDIIRPNMTQGQIVCLLGPSGRGKTQLFRIIAGLQKPTTGQVLIGPEGTVVRPGMVGVVSQFYPLLEHRTVLQNLVIAGRQAGLTKVGAREKAMHYLDRFGMADKADQWPVLLSGGQRQRIAICQQLMCSEHLLLMDEPFSGLDPIAVDNVTRTIMEVANENEKNTVFVVTHDVTAGCTVADTLWLMGRDNNPDGSPTSGSYIKYKYNLVEEGLAWRPSITEEQHFLTFVRDIKRQFKEL